VFILNEFDLTPIQAKEVTPQRATIDENIFRLLWDVVVNPVHTLPHYFFNIHHNINFSVIAQSIQ
jgi:hypothetical protein